MQVLDDPAARSDVTPADAQADKKRICEELNEALQAGEIGEIVGKHQQLIDAYYTDVQAQAAKSFQSAKTVAKTGFVVLIGTIAYMVAIDLLSRVTVNGSPMLTGASLEVGVFGTISGVMIEFIAAINFWLYAKASRQFAAFHICLERTHRYLVAYTMTKSLGANRDATLEKLVCIMANAPMISAADIDGSKAGRAPAPSSA